MDTEDILIVGAIGAVLLLLWPRRASADPNAGVIWGSGIGNLLDPVPTVTTEEFYTLPYYLDINSGLFDLPGSGLSNQNVSRGIPL